MEIPKIKIQVASNFYSDYMQKSNFRGLLYKTIQQKTKVRNPLAFASTLLPFLTRLSFCSLFFCVSLSSLIRSATQTNKRTTIKCLFFLLLLFPEISFLRFPFLSFKRGKKERKKMQQWRPENAAMSFDEVSMERSKSFVKALQVMIPQNSDLGSLFEI